MQSGTDNQPLPASGISDDVLNRGNWTVRREPLPTLRCSKLCVYSGIPSSVYFIPLALILSALGIWQARVARRHGVYAALGMIVNVAGMIIFMLLGVLVLFLAILFSGLH